MAGIRICPYMKGISESSKQRCFKYLLLNMTVILLGVQH